MMQHKNEEARRWFRQSLVTMAGVGTAVLLWQLQQLVLLLFASVLAALIFHGLTRLLQRRLRLPFAAALALAVVLPILIIAVVFGLFGNLMVQQFSQLARQLPQSVADLEVWLAQSTEGRQLLDAAGGYAPKVETVVGIVQSGVANLGSGLSQLLIVLVAGIYLAAQGGLYLHGLKRLLSRLGSTGAERSLKAIHTAIGGWLKAQAVGMAFVAIGTSAGLALVGLPSAIAIGLVAGLCEFVPYLGVILVSAPAVLIGFSISLETGVFTIIALVVVQQLQGNVVSPMAQGKLADLPPALTIFSLIGAGILMGPLGVVLAVPLTVVGSVLYREAMGTTTPAMKQAVAQKDMPSEP